MSHAWEPISTAPAMTAILVCGSKRLMGPVVAYRNEWDEWLVSTCSDEHNIYPPLFWQPLPDLPESLESAEK